MAEREPSDEQLVRLRDHILEHASTDPLMQARALLELASHLEARGLIGETIWVCGEISSRFGRAASSEILRVVADATFVQATSFGMVGRHDDELVLYERILTELPASPHITAVISSTRRFVSCSASRRPLASSPTPS